MNDDWQVVTLDDPFDIVVNRPAYSDFFQIGTKRNSVVAWHFRARPADASILIAAIAKVTGCTIEQITTAMGVQLQVAQDENEIAKLRAENKELCIALEDMIRRRNKLWLAEWRRQKAGAYSGWVPMSERWPEKDGQYLVQSRDGDIFTYYYEGFWVEERRACLWTDGSIVAWQPLPESWKANV